MRWGYTSVVWSIGWLTGWRSSPVIAVPLAAGNLSAPLGTRGGVRPYFVLLRVRKPRPRLNLWIRSIVHTAVNQYLGQYAKQTEMRHVNSAHLNAGGCLVRRSQNKAFGASVGYVTRLCGSGRFSLLTVTRYVAVAPVQMLRIAAVCGGKITQIISTGEVHYRTHQRLSTLEPRLRRAMETGVLSAVVRNVCIATTSITISSMMRMRTL